MCYHGTASLCCLAVCSSCLYSHFHRPAYLMTANPAFNFLPDRLYQLSLSLHEVIFSFPPSLLSLFFFQWCLIVHKRSEVYNTYNRYVQKKYITEHAGNTLKKGGISCVSDFKKRTHPEKQVGHKSHQVLLSVNIQTCRDVCVCVCGSVEVWKCVRK